MKVLYVTDVVDRFGATNSFKEMVKELNSKYNVEPIILTSKKGLITKYANDNQFETYAIGYDSVLYRDSENKLKNFVKRLTKRQVQKVKVAYKEYNAMKKVEKLINFDDIDIIHSNINRNDIGARIAQKYKIPHVMHLREFSDLDFNYFPLYNNYINLINSNTNRFIAISRVIKKHWNNKGIPDEKIEVVYNGVDNKKFIPKEKFNDGKIHVIFSGAISPTKGQIEAIKAIKLIKNEFKEKIVLDIYGTGNEEYVKKLHKFILENNLEKNIDFKGYVDNIYEYVGKYDIGLVCSKSEGFGRVTAEYMHAGLIVIASNKGANSELIDNGENGFLYEYGNSDDLSKKIEKVIEEKSDFKQKIVEEAMKKANNMFTAEKNADNVYKIYEEVLGERK